jgi:exopolysaccharide biosynthesis polyprenyl glycosylphosphotransferase
MHYFLSSSKKRQYLLLFCDILVLVVAVFVSYAIRVYINQRNPTFNDIVSRFNPWQVTIICIHLFTLYLFDQYNLNQLINKVRSSILLILSVWLAGLIISGVFFFFPKYVFGRQVLLIHLVMVSISMVLWRLGFAEMRLGEAKVRNVSVAGGSQPVLNFIKEIGYVTNREFRIKGIWIPENPSLKGLDLPFSVYKYNNLKDLLTANDFDVLIFDSTYDAFTPDESRCLLELKYQGKQIYDLLRVYKSLTGKVALNFIDSRWLLQREGMQGGERKTYMNAKRLIDVILSSVFLLLLLPLLLIIAAAIKVDSRGGILFSHERLGKEKKPFQCRKFRTMVEDAEKKSGPVWSSENDARITRVGKVLRKTRLDELPQLWNILKGEMSFVGPRPIRAHFADQLRKKVPFYDLRFSVKPGLSGWAQVQHDYAGSEQGQLEKFQYELFYIENMSLFIDLFIVIKTVQKVFRREGI